MKSVDLYAQVCFAVQVEGMSRPQPSIRLRLPRGQPIDAIWARIATQPDGGEAILSAPIDDIDYPVIGADANRGRSLCAQIEVIPQAYRVPGLAGCGSPAGTNRETHRDTW